EEAQRDTRPAQRRIPLSIALLNDRFEPTALEPIDLPGRFPDETQAALWLAWITAKDGHEALVYFSGAMPPERLWLAPAERVDFTVHWNGRDRIGNLLPPGRYTAHLQSAQLAATHEPARLALDFEIRDSGPIITRIPDPVMQSLQAQERALQEQRRVNEGWQAVQQWQWKPLLPQPHR
ncbi:MAG TPA: hypothetical protein VEU30_05050, partial [Thermoanaerobaculia bacterium]|nr:hypothetical protein [Thermoanaerobaculia bacterium]